MKQKVTVGWREIVSLPSLGISTIKAKIDTGARTSCLHAFQLETFEKDEKTWVRFWIHPKHKDPSEELMCEAMVIDQRIVRDSGGHEEYRYVIQSDVRVGDRSWPIEITLTNRENMSFRMLLGRTAMNERIVVDPGASFLVPLIEKKS
ncbi:ATP-dependent zinc protease [Vibrio sp.]|nr:ATP-dependent zinc protease [Vibrio sp.]